MEIDRESRVQLEKGSSCLPLSLEPESHPYLNFVKESTQARQKNNKATILGKKRVEVFISKSYLPFYPSLQG